MKKGSKSLSMTVLAIVSALLILLLMAGGALALYSWSKTNLLLQVYGLAYDSAHNILYAGCVSSTVYRNDFGGGGWTSTGTVDGVSRVHSLAYDGARNILYAGCNNGIVYKNDFAGGGWASTGGPGASSVESLAYDGARNILYGGCANGTVYGNDFGGGGWTSTGGPGGSNVYSLAYDGARNILYGGCSDGIVYKNDFAGGGWASTGGPGSGGSPAVLSFAYDGARNILYAGCSNGIIYKNDFAGGGWASTGGPGAGQVFSLAYDGANDFLYAGTSGINIDNVFKKDCRGGGGWLTIGRLCGGGAVHGLALDGARNILYGGTYDYDATHTEDVYQFQLPRIASTDPATGARGSTLNVNITAANTDFQSDVEAHFSGSGITVNSTTRVSATLASASITIDSGAALGSRDVWVTYKDSGGASDRANMLANAFTVTVNASATWYLAEGSTAWGFSQYITIINPNPQVCTARITYMTSTGPTSPPNVTLPATSQTTVNPRDYLGAQDFSTKVECLDELPIAVDRTMTWTGPGAASEEAHNSIGVTSPVTTWYLAEGSSAWGFECWLLIQNPNSSEATCQVTYMVEGAGPNTVTKKVPANSRCTYNMADDIGNADASIKVEADIPVIPERAMYRNNRREGQDSIGTTAPAQDYYLAEGTTAWGFTTYVLVQNPQNTPTDVTITYMTLTGPVYQTPFNMPANSRKTIRVNDILPNTDISTRVHGSQPIIAERAMYWGADKPLGEACHDSIGMDAPHTTFYLPDGETSNGRETWTLIQNPNSSSVAVEVSYLTPSGAGNVIFYDNIPANSRKTYNMADSGVSGRAAVMVRSLTTGQKIMVERAMYWNNRGAGTDTIGGYSD
jgi:hypothetical protein